MCLFPRKIVTPYEYISVDGGQPLTMYVPCGKCAECKKSHRLLWHFRTFYEVQDCLEHNGFVLYDTLTYSDEYLPKLSHFLDISNTEIKDFSCFNHKHFKDFLKRLRRRLSYSYCGVTFKYFLTSEYGTDERFTHRPHYHVLFFVYTNGVKFNSLDMSLLISECWYYGRTDGLPYQPVDYVRENTFVKTNDIDYKKHLRVCSYVSKYITKDSEFQNEINNRIQLISSIVNDDDKLKELLRSINMFHRQSQGFGLYYLRQLDNDEEQFIFDNGACRIIDEKKVTVTIPLPLYYKRKLYYRCVKIDGKIKWQPTSLGLLYIENRYIKNIEKATDSLYDVINNMTSEDKETVSNLLQGRDIQQLAIYNLYYKGYSRHMIEFTEHLSIYNDIRDDEHNLYEWLNKIVQRKSLIHINEYSYLKRDRENKTIEIINHDGLFGTSKNYHYDTFRRAITFNQYSAPHFNNFDHINSIIERYKKEENKGKQRYFDHVEQMKKRYKYIFNKK